MKGKDKETLDLYIDYAIVSTWQITAVWLSEMLDKKVWHDRITSFLSKNDFWSKDMWKIVKKDLRKEETEDWVIAFDDTIEEKMYMKENDIICWHWDHVFWRNVKWLNLLLMSYVWPKLSLPIAYEIVKKTETYIDKKSWKERRKSKKNKNEMFRDMIDTIMLNQIKFKYFLFDSWFCNKDNINKILKIKKDFIAEIPSNRKVSLTKEDKLNWKSESIDSLWMDNWEVLEVYIAWVEKKLLLCRQVFKNKDNSTWERYLLCSDTSLGFDSITGTYKKRWKIEESFKSMKSNTWFANSPAYKVRTQSNHIFISIISSFKLQALAVKWALNSFALKRKIYISALKKAFEELQSFKQKFT